MLTVAACSDPPKPEKIADLQGSEPSSTFYRYRPGSTLNDYVTLDVGIGQNKRTVLSISSCSAAGARVIRGVADVVLFNAEFAGQPANNQKKYEKDLKSGTGLVIRVLSVEPKPSDLNVLRQQGFTIIECNT